MTPTQRLVARVVALASAYFAVSILERVAAAAEADAASSRLAAHAADEALWAHLTGDGCSAPPRDRYALCDATCTADCGACKGAGRPVGTGGGE